MIVDDDQTTLTLVEALLEDAGFEVVTRDSALGTGAQIASEQPDFLILDINMPALTGDQVAELIRNKERLAQTRLVFYSGRPEAELRAFASKYGALGYISKSGNHAEFLKAFEDIVARSDVGGGGT